MEVVEKFVLEAHFDITVLFNFFTQSFINVSFGKVCIPLLHLLFMVLTLTKDMTITHFTKEQSILGPIQRSPRIGIDYAQPKDKEALLRFFV